MIAVCAPTWVAVPVAVVPITVAACGGGILGMIVGELAPSDRVGRWVVAHFGRLAAGAAVAGVALLVVLGLVLTSTGCVTAPQLGRLVVWGVVAEVAVCIGVGWVCGSVAAAQDPRWSVAVVEDGATGAAPVAAPVAVWTVEDRQALDALGVRLD